jgi:hypothetical protein
MPQVSRLSSTPLHPFNNPKGEQKANRESLRRVRANDLARRNDEDTPLTPRKHALHPHSNRELEAHFFGPSRGGSFLSDPPAVRPRLRRRARPAETQIHLSPRDRNSNRKSMRLESPATPTHFQSNREKSTGSTGTPACVGSRRSHPANHNRAAQTSTKPKPKTPTTLPRFSFRLKRPSVLYFQELTSDFNRTMFRLSESKSKGGHKHAT